MSESTIVLPVVVEDRAALAELKKIQKELGHAGLESAKLNKQIEDAMKNMAKSTAKAYGDMGMSLQGLKNKFADFRSAMGAAGVAFGFAKQAVELANFGAELRRLQSAIPVERLAQLREETKGTVSEFDLLKRAAKEMGLSATAGMDEQALALKRGLADWSNFVDQAKASIGGLISTAIVGIVDLSTALGNAISGEEQLRRTAGLAAENAATRARLAQGWAAFDAAKAPELNDRTKQYFEQEAAQTLGIGKVFPKGVSDFVKGYKPPKQRRGGGGPADTSWTFGDLLRPSGPNYVADGIRTGAGAIDRWSSDGWAFGAGQASGNGDIWSAGMAAGGRLNSSAAADQRMADFSSKLQDRTQLLGGAFGALSDGLAASVEAAITGSESIGKAWMRASAMALKAIATEQAVRALVAGASAIGALATGSPGAAAAFGKEAAMHAAAAAAAGIGAAALGAGSSGASSGGPSASSQPGGGNYASSGGGGGSSSQMINVYVTGAISAGDHQKLGAEISKAIRAGRAGGRTRDEQTITTRFE